MIRLCGLLTLSSFLPDEDLRVKSLHLVCAHKYSMSFPDENCGTKALIHNAVESERSVMSYRLYHCAILIDDSS